jgi:hypothetical protein
MSWVPGPKTAEEGLCPPLVPDLLKLLPLSSPPNTMFLAHQIPDLRREAISSTQTIHIHNP